MRLRKSMLHGVYAITDPSFSTGQELAHAVENAILGGAQIIQYRDKDSDAKKRYAEAEALQYVCQRHEVPLIINDDIELARACCAAGVHLGETDISIELARERLGDDAIIGASCYDSLQRAQQAQASGANYVAFGSVFASPTKPDAIRIDLDLLVTAKRILSIPVCAIGGINASNAATVLETGVDLLAVISDIFGHPDVEEATRQLAALFRD